MVTDSRLDALPSAPPPGSSRPQRARGTAAALLLLAAASCSKPEEVLRPEDHLSLSVTLKASDGLLTREGARLAGAVDLTVSSADTAPRAEVRQAARTAVLEALRGALADGPRPTAEDLRPRLEVALSGKALQLVSLGEIRLDVPGLGRRDVLRPESDLELVVIGLDGWDWDIAEPLMEAGRLPVLSDLVRRGTRARLATLRPILSPVIWTSVATGRRPEDHGIIDFLGRDSAGRPVPVTSNLRRAKAFWNVLSEAEQTVGVVAWWATWPAEPVRGFLVSDRVAYQLFQVDDRALPSAGKAYPPAAWEEIAPLIVRPEDVTDAELRPFLGQPPTPPISAQDAQLLDHFRSVLASTRTYAAISLRLHERRRPRVGAYYFQGPDTAAHLFMRHAPPGLPEVPPASRALFGPVVDRVYELHDRILGRFVELAGDRTAMLVLSDHGFRSGGERPASDSRIETPTAADWHSKFGVLVVAGPGIRQGHVLEEATVLDVFPTMLALLGMPVAEDLAGRVLEEALTDRQLAEHPVRTVPTFEDEESEASDTGLALSSAEDRAILESLVAIGYVSSSALGPPAGEAPPDGPAGGDPALGANAHNNLGTIWLSQGDVSAAISEFRKAVELSPAFIPARINLAQALLQGGEPAEAEGELDRVLAAEPANPRAVALAAELHLDEGDGSAAERLARRAVEADPRFAGGWMVLGSVLERAGRTADARAAYLRAAGIEPENAEARNAVGNLAESSGDYREAARWYEKAVEADPHFAPAYNNLALQHQRLGDWDEALRVYERGREKLPGSSVLLNNLATWHHQLSRQARDRLAAAEAAGDEAAAERSRRERDEHRAAATELYREAMAANPLDPSPVNNLGGLLGESGQAQRQRELYEQALDLDPDYADARFNLADWHAKRGQFDEAEGHLGQLLGVHPDHARALRLRAELLFTRGRAPEALDLMERAIERQPRQADLRVGLGALRDALGETAAACEAYRSALALDPRQPLVRARVSALCGRPP